ncbi:hypothetical protein NZL82_15415 [Sphingomonas sanguinis]|uniref:hypothetical protein n=1 Tax=Sphingomonas sp. LC-1 TaxID=3110957 RepID=UPI0021BBA064|nr:hypothetical protein [Sphingomonas sp. LC-1]MCT8003264.1 hypothetical protein [Sphingomonas sp. LC-1]
MNIGWPQGILLALLFLSVCLHASKNGRPREGHYDLGASMLTAAIWVGLTYWGGFFG